MLDSLRQQLEYIQRRTNDALVLEGTEYAHLIPEVLHYLKLSLDNAQRFSHQSVKDRILRDPVFAAGMQADQRRFAERIDEALAAVTRERIQPHA